MGEELKPCPFCGTSDFNIVLEEVYHTIKCLCPIAYVGISKEHWNARQPQPPQIFGMDVKVDPKLKGNEFRLEHEQGDDEVKQFLIEVRERASDGKAVVPMIDEFLGKGFTRRGKDTEGKQELDEKAFLRAVDILRKDWGFDIRPIPKEALDSIAEELHFSGTRGLSVQEIKDIIWESGLSYERSPSLEKCAQAIHAEMMKERK